MKKHQTVQVATGGQIKELASALVEAIPSNIAADKAQYWIGKKKKLAKEIRNILFGNNSNSDYSDILPDWQNFYKNNFNQDYDFSNIAIPAKPEEGKWRLLIIANLSLEQLYAKCKERFKSWRWTNDNLDKIVTFNERDAKNGAYAIWARDEIEADEKYKNISANKIKEMGIKTETLAERLIHELKFFAETGNHLDIRNITLCSGSRDSDGGVPRVFWGGGYGGVGVSWDGSGHAYDFLRAREAVSLN